MLHSAGRYKDAAPVLTEWERLSAGRPHPRTELYAQERNRASRIGLWALALFFGGFLLWAAFAPLDEGVPSQGMVSIDTKRRPCSTSPAAS